jgi:hypothetical protein
MSEVRERVCAGGWDSCFVTNQQGVSWAGSDERRSPPTTTSVEDAMTLGPSIVRPSLELEKAVQRMRRQSLTTLPVTRSDGVFRRFAPSRRRRRACRPLLRLRRGS